MQMPSQDKVRRRRWQVIVTRGCAPSLCLPWSFTATPTRFSRSKLTSTVADAIVEVARLKAVTAGGYHQVHHCRDHTFQDRVSRVSLRLEQGERVSAIDRRDVASILARRGTWNRLGHSSVGND